MTIYQIYNGLSHKGKETPIFLLLKVIELYEYMHNRYNVEILFFHNNMKFPNSLIALGRKYHNMIKYLNILIMVCYHYQI